MHDVDDRHPLTVWPYFSPVFEVSSQLDHTPCASACQVGGIIETKRPDAKNALYLETIRRGDLLLNRVQKLSRVIDVD